MIPVYRPGVPVLFEREVYAASPVRDAVSVRPTPRGECYQCTVREHGVVLEIDPFGMLLIETAAGERLQLAASDSRLKRRSWIARCVAWLETLAVLERS